jgi:quinol monooxygenase YgiN
MFRNTRSIQPVFVPAMLACAAVGTAMPAHSSEPTAAASYEKIPRGAFSVVAQVRAKPGKEAQLRAVTLPLIALVRSDPNNLVYFLQENREAPGHFIFYEVFANREHFEAHNNMPYVKAWFAKLPDLAQGGVEVMRMEVLAAPGK